MDNQMKEDIAPNNDSSESSESSVYREYTDEELMEIRRRMEERRAQRRAANHRRIMRNRIVAIAILLVIGVLIFRACHKNSSDPAPAQNSSSAAQTDSAKQAEVKTKTTSSAKSTDNADSKSESQHTIEQTNGMTFVDGILIVNKTYSLPEDYAPGVSTLAQNAFDEMAAAAANDGITLFVNSSYRSYQDQEALYNSYAWERGTEAADEVSSRPGHSEHQTGLTFDVNTTENSFAGTPEANWLAEHCAEYGFIIRYPDGKEDKTGYMYEPWHIRYLGKEKAKAVTESGLCLEEYLGVTSDYKYAEDQHCDSLNSSDTDTQN